MGESKNDARIRYEQQIHREAAESLKEDGKTEQAKGHDQQANNLTHAKDDAPDPGKDR